MQIFKFQADDKAFGYWVRCTDTYTSPCNEVPEVLACNEEAGDLTNVVEVIISIQDCLYGKASEASGFAPLDPTNAMDAYNAYVEAMDTCGNPDETVNILSLMWAVFWPAYASAARL